MQKLFDFLIRKRHWFLFIFLEIISVLLLFRSNAYQRSVILSTANRFTGSVVSLSGSVNSYLNLRETNQDLLVRNGELEMELLRLKSQIGTLEADSLEYHNFVADSGFVTEFPYTSITAQVVSNSVTQLSNYITINKGLKDGVENDMGVVSERGVVGIVLTASDNYSIVIPLLNPKFKLSCKVLGSSHFGSMSWNGRSTRYANLDQLPRHVEFQVGDTIVTSGYSAVFPEGIIVGKVSSFRKENDDNFYSLEVELSTDFHALNNVRVIKNYDQKERKLLEERARRNDK